MVRYTWQAVLFGIGYLLAKEPHANSRKSSHGSIGPGQYLAKIETTYCWYDEEEKLGEGHAESRVQIDESKFGKRKYNRGARVDGHWVFGAVEVASKKLRVYVCPEGKRTEEVLGDLIEKSIEKGTTIVSDMYSSYHHLDKVESGYNHEVVNHSIEYAAVNEDGTINHTNNIEAAWRPMKDWFRNKRIRGEYFFYHLKEYEWRRRMAKEGKSVFEELVKLIAKKWDVSTTLTSTGFS